MRCSSISSILSVCSPVEAHCFTSAPKVFAYCSYSSIWRSVLFTFSTACLKSSTPSVNTSCCVSSMYSCKYSY